MGLELETWGAERAAGEEAISSLASIDERERGERDGFFEKSGERMEVWNWEKYYGGGLKGEGGGGRYRG